MPNETQSQNEEVKTLELEVAPIESITRAEVDIQIETAKNHPRSLEQFKKRAMDMVSLDEETAASCIYHLTRKDRNAPNGVKVIEGESIRMAEIVASTYGNLRSAVHIAGHTPTRVTVRAVCHDLETNNLIAVEKQARTAYKDGSPYNEDMAIMTTNATISKALRDAIFRVVPKALLKPITDKARQVALGNASTLAKHRDNMTKWIEYWKIDPARVWAVLGVKGLADVGMDQVKIFVGLRTAIKDAEQTVDEAFPILENVKPILEHPEKARQEALQKEKAEAATKDAIKSAVKEAVQKQKEQKAIEPKPAPAETAEAAQAEKEEAALGLAPQKPPENVVEMPKQEEKKAAPAAEPAPVAQPEPAAATPAAALSEAQEGLRKVVEGAGYTWDEFAGWGKATIFPKVNPPTGWGTIPDAQAQRWAVSVKGIMAALKSWRDKHPVQK